MFLKVIGADLRRLTNVSIWSLIRLYVMPRGTSFPYIFWLRVLQMCRRYWILRWTFGLIVYPIYRHFEFKYGIHANPNVDIGEGLCIVHGGNVHLNCDSIGKNLTVYQGVTFGVHDGSRPIVGDNVTVYPNSVIVGGIKIGDNATIGALSYVSHDVPPGTTVIGCPAHEIRKNKP